MRPVAEPANERRRARRALALAVLTATVLAGCTGPPVIASTDAPPGTSSDISPELSGITRPIHSSASGPLGNQPVARSDAVSVPTWVHAPAAGIDTALVPVGVDDDGALEVPGLGTAAWYDLGPRPGEPGPAVLIGHAGDVHGAGVFRGLGSLDRGDMVTVTDARSRQYRFAVETVEVVEKSSPRPQLGRKFPAVATAHHM